jgi:hypothetical protein
VIIVESAISGAGAPPAGQEAPTVKLSKAEAAALKVAAMAKEEDQPKLIETGPVKRSSRSGRAPKSKPAAAKETKPKPSKRGSPEPASEPSPPPPAAKPPKPKMRLVNGKLIPAEDGPKLF